MALPFKRVQPVMAFAAAHLAIEQWMETEGLVPAGAPWESYLNDPSDFPDPKDWKTEISWPVASKS